MAYSSPVSLCFDLDGTLVDTAPDLIRVLNIVLAEEGLAETAYEAARKSVGYGARRLIIEACERAAHRLSDSRLDALQSLFLKIYAEDIAQLSYPYPGVFTTLTALKANGARLSVCTNKPGFLARPLLDTLGMTHFFERIIGSDDTARKKPHPDHIYDAAGHKGRHPILMIGDSAPDILAAKNADIPSILMRYGYSNSPPERLGATHILRHFRDIPACIETILERR